MSQDFRELISAPVYRRGFFVASLSQVWFWEKKTGCREK